MKILVLIDVQYRRPTFQVGFSKLKEIVQKILKKAMAGTLSVCMLATGVSGVGELGGLVHKSSVVYAVTTKNIVS